MTSNRGREPDSWIASFGAWMFTTGLLGGFFMGAVAGRFFW